MKTFILHLSSILLIILKISITVVSLDTITKTQFLQENDTLISSDGTFEMGFFRPGKSNNWYIGIWYTKVSNQTVVWVANREIPITNKTGSALKITDKGVLVLVNGTNDVIWVSTNTSGSSSSPLSPVAQLLDSGNIVIRDENDSNPDNYIWQSFDHPTDTHLPGMKLGRSFEKGVEWYITSWKSSDDPGLSEYTYHMDPSGYPQLMIKNGGNVIFRNGPWIGNGFSGRPSSTSDNVFNRLLVSNQEEVYFTFKLVNNSVMSRFVLTQDVGRRWVWVNPTTGWVFYLSIPTDVCDNYSRCGPNSLCRSNLSPVCWCLDNFVPKSSDNWAVGDWSGGCVRNKSLNCEKGDMFRQYTNVKLPDARWSWFDKNMSLNNCKAKCLKNCSCTAYSNLDFQGKGNGCLLWFNDLIDMKDMGENAQYLFVRIPSDKSGRHSLNKRVLIALTSSLSVGTVLLVLSLSLYAWKRKPKLTIRRSYMEEPEEDYSNNGSQNEDIDLPFFAFTTIATATNNFSRHNKLGEGGFGPVYKGVLEDGGEVAVKRLSKTSTQGAQEFKNEVKCIAKLQHRNLVKLLGYCIQGDEKILLYEYMPNNSLEKLIFDETQRKLLDWPKRFTIVMGISRGILYLHQDSRLRVIHRDLKASNILLDSEMNPKISDFGSARCFGGNETEANTMRLVGTIGYMSPEYAADGVFSTKSDVFSFGVLLLEIVSGKTNRGFVHPYSRHNLLGHAWRLHLEGKSLKLMDEALGREDECHNSEVRRTIQVGLLCVQQNPEHRPDMSSVILMLGNEGPLPEPKQPGFFTERTVFETSSGAPSPCNEITSTVLIHGR